MNWNEDLTARCNQLLAINRALFDTDHLEAAYHALEAALHCASDCGDRMTIHHVGIAAAVEHQRLVERARLAQANPALSPTESRRWASLESLYAVAVRQANLKALNLDPHSSGGFQ